MAPTSPIQCATGCQDRSEGEAHRIIAYDLGLGNDGGSDMGMGVGGLVRVSLPGVQLVRKGRMRLG